MQQLLKKKAFAEANGELDNYISDELGRLYHLQGFVFCAA